MPRQRSFNKLSRRPKGFRGTPYQPPARLHPLEVEAQANEASSGVEMPAASIADQPPVEEVVPEVSGEPVEDMEEQAPVKEVVNEVSGGLIAEGTEETAPVETSTAKKFALSSHCLSSSDPSFQCCFSGVVGGKGLQTYKLGGIG